MPQPILFKLRSTFGKGAVAPLIQRAPRSSELNGEALDPAKRTTFGGQQGTLADRNRTFTGYDFGSNVEFNALSVTQLNKPVGYVEFTVKYGLGSTSPFIGLANTAYDWTTVGNIGQRAGSWGVLPDGGGAAVVYAGSGTVGPTPPTIADGATVGMIVHKATGKVWLVHPNGTIYPDTPVFAADGSLTSGTGYASGLTDFYFATSTRRNDGASVNTGQFLPVRTLPANVALGWYDAVPVASTLTDNFNDNTTNVANWTVDQFLNSVTTVGGTVTETNQRLEIVPPVSSNRTSGYVSVGTFSLISSEVVAQITLAGGATALAASQNAYIAAGQSNQRYYAVEIAAGNIRLREYIQGVSETNFGVVAYVPATHAWFRLREAAGTVYFDTAPSTASNPPVAGDWTNRASTAKSASINLVAAKLAIQLATQSAEAAPVTVYFDGFNTSATVVSVTNYVYLGPSSRATRYKGAKTDAALYLGAKGLGWV